MKKVLIHYPWHWYDPDKTACGESLPGYGLISHDPEKVNCSKCKTTNVFISRLGWKEKK